MEFNKMLYEYYINKSYDKLFFYYLGYLIILLLFVILSIWVIKKLGENEKSSVYVYPAFIFIMGLPLFIFISDFNYKIILNFSLYFLYSFCGMKNFIKLYNMLSQKNKYYGLLSIIAVHMPLVILLLIQIYSTNNIVNVSAYIIIVFLSVILLFINKKIQ